MSIHLRNSYSKICHRVFRSTVTLVLLYDLCIDWDKLYVMFLDYTGLVCRCVVAQAYATTAL